MRSNTKDIACGNLARVAWILSDRVGGDDITYLAHEVAGATGGDWAEIRDDIVAGLECMSDCDCSEDAERAIMGHCDMGEVDCYWWHNGAETRWTSDKPDWWEEQVALWSR
jgi:hypothetical protein